MVVGNFHVILIGIIVACSYSCNRPSFGGSPIGGSPIGGSPPSGGCPGCPVQVVNLSEEQHELVDWAVSQLEGEDGACKKQKVDISGFTSQVVAGIKSKITLVLEHDPSNPPECRSPSIGSRETCIVTIWEQSWLNFREIQPEETTCLSG